MRKHILILLLISLAFSSKTHALVDFDNPNSPVTPGEYGTCGSKDVVYITFAVNWQTNNASFQVQRSKDINFSWSITGTWGFNGNVSGCGTCGYSTYSVTDYGPFIPGEVWYYRVKAASNNANFQYKYLGSYTTPHVVSWVSQVTSQVITGTSPATDASYQWEQMTKQLQGTTISLMPTEITKIYLEQWNNHVAFSVQDNTPFISIDVNIDDAGYSNIYNGSQKKSFTWNNTNNYVNSLGYHNLKVRFLVGQTYFYREYYLYIVPTSSALYHDNYCNSMRVWKGNDPVNGTPLLLSEGFDAYNTKPEQYYREAGNELINCLLSKGFNVYVLNYKLNSQSIKNNAAVYQSAIRYLSSINGNK